MKLIQVLPQDKVVSLGLGQVGQSQILYAHKAEVIGVKVDWSQWLEGETIASFEVEAVGSTYAPSESAGKVTGLIDVSRTGHIKLTITSSGGRVKDLCILVSANAKVGADSYLVGAY